MAIYQNLKRTPPQKNSISIFFITYVLSIIRPYPIGIWGRYGAYISVLSTAVIVLAVVVVWGKIEYREQSLRLSLLFVFIHFSLYIFTTLTSLDVNNIESIPELFRFVIAIPFLLLGYRWALESNFNSQFTRAIQLIIVLNVVVGVWQTASGGTPIDVFYMNDKTPSTLANPQAFGLFWNPNPFAYFLVLSATILLFIGEKPGINWIFVLIAVIGIVLSGSRSGVGALFLVGLLYLVTIAPRSARILFPIFLCVTISLILIPGVLPDTRGTPFNRFVVSVRGASEVLNWSTLTARFRIWSKQIEYFRSAPLFGNGPMRGTTSTSDNYYVYLLVHSGIVGIIWYILLNALFISFARQAATRSDEPRLFWLGIALAVAINTTNLVAESFIIVPVMNLFFLLLGIFGSYGNSSNKSIVDNQRNNLEHLNST